MVTIKHEHERNISIVDYIFQSLRSQHQMLQR